MVASSLVSLLPLWLLHGVPWTQQPRDKTEGRSLLSCSKPLSGSISLKTPHRVLTITSKVLQDPDPYYFSNLISYNSPSLTLLQSPWPFGVLPAHPASRLPSSPFPLLKMLFSQLTHFNVSDSDLLCSFYLMKLYLPQYSSPSAPIFP